MGLNLIDQLLVDLQLVSDVVQFLLKQNAAAPEKKKMKLIYCLHLQELLLQNHALNTQIATGHATLSYSHVQQTLECPSVSTPRMTSPPQS